MKIANPRVTLADEARAGVDEAVRSGFLDWLHQFSLTGDDGELYSVGGAILSMSLEKLDVVTLTVARGEGQSRQLPESVYKVTEYPGMLYERMWRQPAGSLSIERCGDCVRVSCGPPVPGGVFCRPLVALPARLARRCLSGRFVASPLGLSPLVWAGDPVVSHPAQHPYGYNWSGVVTGEIVLNGRSIRVSGMGIRERYVAVDSCAAEIGGWEDWGWVSFNEMHASMYDMRLGMKDFALYDLATQRYYPEGKLTITHEDWAFLRELDGFIPTTYHISIEVADGRYEAEAHVCNATTWGATHRVPDNPVATLTYGRVTGTFNPTRRYGTGVDGRTRHHVDTPVACLSAYPPA